MIVINKPKGSGGPPCARALERDGSQRPSLPLQGLALWHQRRAVQESSTGSTRTPRVCSSRRKTILPYQSLANPAAGSLFERTYECIAVGNLRQDREVSARPLTPPHRPKKKWR